MIPIILFIIRQRKIRRLLNALAELNCTINDVVNSSDLKKNYFSTIKMQIV